MEFTDILQLQKGDSPQNVEYIKYQQNKSTKGVNLTYVYLTTIFIIL